MNHEMLPVSRTNLSLVLPMLLPRRGTICSRHGCSSKDNAEFEPVDSRLRTRAHVLALWKRSSAPETTKGNEAGECERQMVAKQAGRYKESVVRNASVKPTKPGSSPKVRDSRSPQGRSTDGRVTVVAERRSGEKSKRALSIGRKPLYIYGVPYAAARIATENGPERPTHLAKWRS
ncbi:hypothetical protein KM043_011693 [Ampulex compressa]|nr:hypothetical protein KM043_011693 [Ampulex compressa]